MRSPIDLRLGRWQDVLSDVTECDAVICDPPYTERTVLGYMSGNHMPKRSRSLGHEKTMSIDYDAVDEEWLRNLARWASSASKSWIVIFNDHIGSRYIEDELKICGEYVFSPVVWVRKNAPPRFNCDGPNDSVEYITVARKRTKRLIGWGCLKGYYDVPIATGHKAARIRVGEKPIDLMRAIIRDYTRPGWLVCDPCAGGGTTLIAAAIEGRRAIGAEMDQETYRKAKARIDRGYTPLLPGLGD